MFFTSLLPVLKGCKALTVMIVPGEGDKLTVTVIPKPKADGDGDESALATPLALTGTSAELDEKFAEIIGKFSQARSDLEEQLETTTAVLEAATRASSDKASGALKKAGKRDAGGKGAPSPAGDGNDDDDDESGGAAASAGGTANPSPAPAAAAEPNLFV